MWALFHLLLIPIAAIALGYLAIKKKTIIRVEWDSVAKFLAFMALVTCIRLAIKDFTHTLYPDTPLKNPILELIPIWSLLFVWWEDVIYGMSIYWLKNNCPKKVWIPLAVLISIEFGMGHLYQGSAFAVVAMAYPYVISCKYGEKYGFGTVMVGHILYDYITLFAMILTPYLLS